MLDQVAKDYYPHLHKVLEKLGVVMGVETFTIMMGTFSEVYLLQTQAQSIEYGLEALIRKIINLLIMPKLINYRNYRVEDMQVGFVVFQCLWNPSHFKQCLAHQGVFCSSCIKKTVMSSRANSLSTMLNNKRNIFMISPLSPEVRIKSKLLASLWIKV
jgi:hypothetical protein